MGLNSRMILHAAHITLPRSIDLSGLDHTAHSSRYPASAHTMATALDIA
jgi:hypothetical protein